MFASAQIEIPLPNEGARLEILKIHASSVTKFGDIGQCCSCVLNLSLDRLPLFVCV